ncbi:MAG: DNA gyrase subunit A [Planctomycetes bacterium]|nr:DNA gyrase subunit A [Planctomycetota bacterium]
MRMEDESRIENMSIEDEMKGSYLTYAMSVIISRALPDVRDGLKPSQRRILVAMNDLNLGPRGQHRKCAKIAGDTSGNYHPHGESVIYPTLVRMAQEFSIRYPLVDPQGNFGSIDGDPPAAMRYTEARMTSASVEMLEDLDKQTVDFVRNYDETRDEPTVLPGKFPNLLVNGGSGIAVGMATNMPPHNITEILNAILALLDDPDITIDEIMNHVPGPDFPTRGVICGRRGILSAYKTGRGILTLRAKVETEEKKGRVSLVITEIPYQVSKAKLAEDIAKGVRDGRFSGISDIRDESDRTGIRLVVEIKRGENEEVILNHLFKHTQLQTSFGVQNVALVNGRPRTLDIKQMLEAYRDHRMVVIRRRSRFLLEKAERRAHILRGLLIALDHIDRVIELIRASQTPDEARAALMAEFDLTRIQAEAILQMRLQRLTGLERDKLEEELQSVLADIDFHREVITSRTKVLGIIRQDVEEMLGKFGDKRRTEIIDSHEDIDIEDLIAEEQVVVTLSHQGYIKRTPVSTYRSQGRGGRGITAGSSREGDFIKNLFVASTHDYIMFFTNYGKVYWLKVYDIPDLARTSKGRAIVNLLPFESDERVMSSLQVREFDSRNVVFATRKGIVKKTVLEAYSRPKKTGIIAIVIDEGDELIAAQLTSGEDDVVLSTAKGMAIRFPESGVRQMGRVSRGVKGITLVGDDFVVGMAVVSEGGSLLTICEHGFGKRTKFEEYRSQSRGGKGLIDIRASSRNGRVVTALSIVGGEHAMLMTQGGMLVRIEVDGFRDIGRATQGVRLIRVREGDSVIGAELVEPDDADEVERPDDSEPGDGEESTASSMGGDDLPEDEA